MPATSCPQPDQIRQFLTGKLDPDEIEAVSAHLEQCPTCDETTGRLESECTVKIAVDAEDAEFEDEPALQAMLQRIKQAPTSSAASDSLTLNPGDRVGPFRIERLVAHGGMGKVYSARHEHLQRQVALKVIPAKAQQGVASRERFLREMRINGQLTHPHIVQTFDAGESCDSLYLAMEFLEGIDLGELLRRGGPLPAGAACEVVRQAALGVEHAHQAGVIHRDLKPSNLFLTCSGDVKVLDLGLGRLAGETNQEELTRAGQFVGTVDYMSPEQIDSALTLDHRTDVYSLGATLLKLMTGSAPFPDEPYDTLLKKLQAIASQEDVEIGSRLNDVPQDLVALLQQMLRKDPEKRLSSANEVAERLTSYADADALRQFAFEQSSAAPNPAAPPAAKPEPAAPRKSRSLIYGLVAAAAIALAAVFVIPSAKEGPSGRNQQSAEQTQKQTAGTNDEGPSDQTIALSANDFEDPAAEAEANDQLEKPNADNGQAAIDPKEKPKGGARGAADAAATEIEQPIPLAVLEFRDFTKLDAAAGLTNLVSARLMENDRLYLVERQQLEQVLKEQSLNLSGLVGPQQQIQIGKLTGARLMLTGTLTQLDQDLLLSTKLFSTETGQVKGVSVTGKTSDDLAELADDLAEKVLKLVQTQAANLVPPSKPPADRLAELKKLLKDREKPSLSVHITERHIGQPTTDPAAETEFSKMALACDFPLVDSTARAKSKPDLIVRGEAFSELAGRRGDLVIVRARVEIEVTQRKTGEILVKDRETTVHVGTAENVAGKTALQKAAGRLAERVLPALAPADGEE